MIYRLNQLISILHQMNLSEIIALLSLFISLLSIIISYKLIKIGSKYAKKEKEVDYISSEIELIKYELNNLCEEINDNFTTYHELYEDKDDAIVNIYSFIENMKIRIYNSIEVIKRKLITINQLLNNDNLFIKLLKKLLLLENKDYNKIIKQFQEIEKVNNKLYIITRKNKEIEEKLEELDTELIEELASTNEDFNTFDSCKNYFYITKLYDNKEDINKLCNEMNKYLSDFELSIKKYLRLI